VDAINRGVCPIHEKGLPEIIARHAGSGLTATADLSAAVRGSELTLIAAPTPFDGKVIDLTFIKQIATQIGNALKAKAGYHVVVVKSTVVPGTTDDVVGALIEEASGKLRGEQFGLGMNPEFLSEGVAVHDFMNPDRIVLGGIDARTQDAIAELYASFESVPLIPCNNATAEMIKYASNALQASMISFANEIANICEGIGAVDALDVMRGVHAMKELTVHADGRRVRSPITSFLSPGCGFGGSCFPKDVKALNAHAAALNVDTPLLAAVLAINAERPKRLVDQAEAALGGLKGRRVAVLGLAFKPETDDLRESPALSIVRELQRRGASVVAFDPIANEAAKRALDDSPPEFAASLEGAIEGVEAVVLVTRWAEFASLGERLLKQGSQAVVIDGRRLIDPQSVHRYIGVGLKGERS